MESEVKRFEDLEVWKESMKLVSNIYISLKLCKDFGLKDQMQRAAVSIPSNISEGFERQTNKELIQFLYIAKGSCGELRTQLYIASKLEYLPENQAKELINDANRISAMIYRLIQYRKKFLSNH